METFFIVFFNSILFDSLVIIVSSAYVDEHSSKAISDACVHCCLVMPRQLVNASDSQKYGDVAILIDGVKISSEKTIIVIRFILSRRLTFELTWRRVVCAGQVE